MSRAQLKKELNSLSKEQIIEVILELYALRKDAKEYFEYYLNLDVDSLYEKYETKIFKELFRAKKFRRYGSKPENNTRISHIKKAIKEFDSFGSGKEWKVKLMFSTITKALEISELYSYTVKYAESLMTLLQDTMLEADESGVFHEYASKILSLTKLDTTGTGVKTLRQYYIRALHGIGMETEYSSLLPPEKMNKKTLNTLNSL